MLNLTQKIHFIFVLFTLTISNLCFANKQVNPDYMYFNNGDTPEGWVWVLGDKKNWWMPLEANEGKSATGKVSITPSNYKANGDAVTIKWSKKKDVWGMVNIAGRTIDLTKFQNNAELILVVKVDRKVKSDVNLAMACGEDCKGEVPIKDLLNSAKPKTWFVLPVALDCFVYAGAKLDSISQPVSIGSGGRLELSIASAHIQAMQKGDEGCIPNEPVQTKAEGKPTKEKSKDK